MQTEIVIDVAMARAFVCQSVYHTGGLMRAHRGFACAGDSSGPEEYCLGQGPRFRRGLAASVVKSFWPSVTFLT